MDLREKAIRCVIEDDDKKGKQTEADDDFDNEQPELKIQSTKAALSMVDNLNSFCQTLGDANIISALNLDT